MNSPLSINQSLGRAGGRTIFHFGIEIYICIILLSKESSLKSHRFLLQSQLLNYRDFLLATRHPTDTTSVRGVLLNILIAPSREFYYCHWRRSDCECKAHGREGIPADEVVKVEDEDWVQSFDSVFFIERLL